MAAQAQVWIVEGDSGDYEDARHWISSVHTTEAAALGVCDKANAWARSKHEAYQKKLQAGKWRSIASMNAMGNAINPHDHMRGSAAKDDAKFRVKNYPLNGG